MMNRRTRTAAVYKEPDISDLSFAQTESEEEDSDEWCPSEPKVARRTAKAETAHRKASAKKPAKPQKPKETKPRAPRKPRVPKAPAAPKGPIKPKAPAAPKGPIKPKALSAPQASVAPKGPIKPNASASPKASAALKTTPTSQNQLAPPKESAGGTDQMDPSIESLLGDRVKEERLSFALPAGPSAEALLRAGDEGSSSSCLGLKKEEPTEDFLFDEPSLKRQKTDSDPQGRPSRQPYQGRGLGEELNMNWNPVELLAERSGLEPWVCVNIAQLLREDNTVPFMVRYRKDMINHLDADAVRDVQLILGEIR